MIAAVPAPAPEAPQSAAPANTPGSPTAFDAIFVLQQVNAAVQSLDAASFEPVDTADLLSAEDGEDDDDTADDIESSLAFLSALLTATSPKNSTGDFESGAQGGSAGEDAATMPVKNAANDPAGFALLGGSTEQEPDAGSALTAVRPELLEPRVTGDAVQNLSRAAEMLVQAQRPAAPAVEQVQIATATRDPRWAEEFGARVSLMVRGGESSASLALTPVGMGPVEVSVTVKDSQATIVFGASQADTRALIEASLPRLREMLAAQGFNLTDASVSSGFSGSQQQKDSQDSRAAADSEAAAAEVRSVRALGLLDLYA